MADKRIIQLPNTPGVDTANDEMVVDNATDGARRIPVGRAGGPAILDASGKITDRLAYEGAASGVATLDAAGKLVQPRRVLGVTYAAGSTASPSTTDTIGNYVLPDPRITVDTDAGDVVLLQATAALYADAAGAYVFARIVRSDDGGATWTMIGAYVDFKQVTANYAQTVPLLAIDAPGAGSHIYGITIGNASGGAATIYAHSTYRLLTAMVVDY